MTNLVAQDENSSSSIALTKTMQFMGRIRAVGANGMQSEATN